MLDAEARKLVLNIIETQFGRKVLDISAVARSNNSKVYILTIDAAADKSLPVEGQPRSGVEPLPSNTTQAVVRFTNPDANLNDAVLVENQVAAITLAREALNSLDIPIVPQVYGWSSAANGVGWVLMEFMPGASLEAAEFQKLDEDAKRDIITQIAQLVKLIQKYQLPASIKGYGGLRFSEDGSIVVGPTPIHGAVTPCETYHELYSQYLRTQLTFMDKCDIVRGWKDTDLRERINQFVATGFKPLLERTSESRPRQTLVHADLDLHNLHFDPESGRLTAILDFDFSHIASAADEYFFSFDSIEGLLPPKYVGGPKELLRKYLLEGFDTDVEKREEPEDMVDWETAVLTNKAFFLANVERPVDLMPGIERLSELYWFIQNLSPGAFFLPRFRANMTPIKVEFMRKHFQENLGQILTSWGF